MGTSHGTTAPLPAPCCCRPGVYSAGHLHGRGSTSAGSAWSPDLTAGDGHVLFVVQSVMKMNSHVASDYRLVISNSLMLGADVREVKHQ